MFSAPPDSFFDRITGFAEFGSDATKRRRRERRCPQSATPQSVQRHSSLFSASPLMEVIEHIRVRKDGATRSITKPIEDIGAPGVGRGASGRERTQRSARRNFSCGAKRRKSETQTPSGLGPRPLTCAEQPGLRGEGRRPSTRNSGERVRGRPPSTRNLVKRV
jgi:hypothetical protein